MATSSLNQTKPYTITEFQLLVKDSPVGPAEIQPFVGVSFRCSADIYRLFKGIAEMTVETFLVVLSLRKISSALFSNDLHDP